ncbi:MAG: hypothetical protein KGN36_15265 [Acidobacteriota bacterium]|nr:hypothetical protein [Acidobacteriota bacterium]
MTRAKIAVKQPKGQPAGIRREAQAEPERRESLKALLHDLIEQYGEPGAEDVERAKRALAQRRG